MFNSLNDIVSSNKNLQKFIIKHERIHQGKLKIKTKLVFGCEKQIKTKQNLILDNYNVLVSVRLKNKFYLLNIVVD